MTTPKSVLVIAAACAFGATQCALITQIDRDKLEQGGEGGEAIGGESGAGVGGEGGVLGGAGGALGGEAGAGVAGEGGACQPSGGAGGDCG